MIEYVDENHVRADFALSVILATTAKDLAMRAKRRHLLCSKILI